MPPKRKGKKKVYKKKSTSKAHRKSSFFAPVGKMIGGAAGGYIGGPAGALIGSQLGSSAGSLISKITGFGSYHVSKNTIITNSIPQFQNRAGDGSIRLKHKEFIADVKSSPTPGTFLPITYALSASDANTFPYLSQLAINFEEFAFEGLVFEYITSSGSLSTTGQLGTVVGAVQFNSLAQAYLNKQQMEASTFGQSTVASQSCLFPVECDAMQTPSNGIFYNSRPGITNVNNDKRWSQLGNFTIATVGMPLASETVGELYVSYDCVLMKPILIQDSGSLADHWIASTGIVAPTNYFGTNAVLTAQSDNFTSLTPTTITFNPSFQGKVQVSYAVHGALGAWADPLMAVGAGVTALNILDSNITYQYLKVGDAATEMQLFTVAYFIISSVGGARPVITLSGGAIFAPDYMDLIITSIPADFD